MYSASVPVLHSLFISKIVKKQRKKTPSSDAAAAADDDDEWLWSTSRLFSYHIGVWQSQRNQPTSNSSNNSNNNSSSSSSNNNINSNNNKNKIKAFRDISIQKQFKEHGCVNGACYRRTQWLVCFGFGNPQLFILFLSPDHQGQDNSVEVCQQKHQPFLVTVWPCLVRCLTPSQRSPGRKMADG